MCYTDKFVTTIEINATAKAMNLTS